jgi:general secretion pathway protein D
MSRFSLLGGLALTAGLAGCASLPQPKDDGALQREAIAGTERPAPASTIVSRPTETTSAAVLPQISTGSGQFIKPSALATPRAKAQGPGTVVLNFENQPVEAVVKAILGDLLHENYTIVPGVQGNVSFSTSQAVTNEEALPILETLLSWTGNALVHKEGRYVVLPAKDAVAGNLVPSLGASAPSGGLQARLFPLRYISATEMQKLIKPFARQDSVLLADTTRNVLVMAGTPDELANYQNTVNIFDVDWLRGMSVGVFSLQRANVAELMPALDKLFGAKGDTPLAGLLRFIPIERTNALVVISPQASYLTEVRGWIERIDQGGGNEPQLFVYDVRNVQASDLADYLGDIYGNGKSGGGDSGGKVGPGLSSGSLGNTDDALGGNTNNSGSGLGSNAGGFGNSGGGLGSGSGLGSNGSNGASGGLGGGMLGGSSGSGNDPLGDDSSKGKRSGGVTTGDGIRISAVDANNQLMVRARPSQWTEIESAIKRLDTVPLQVQIETRILEVELTGQFQFGVQWYLEGLSGSTDGKPTQPGNKQQWALGGDGASFNPGANGKPGDAFFYSFVNNNLSVALRALEVSGNSKILSAPSLVVMNNQKAHIQVGDQIPVTQTYVNTGSNTDNTVGQVQYLNTGVILDVRPRVNPGGLVYLNISQVVSKADTTTASANPPISQREVSTRVAVQSGQTVLLGGLIQQDESQTDTGIPGLNRIPVLGRLFGTTSRNRNRTELLVLITPKVITNGSDAKQITDEYQRKFESLAPLRTKPAEGTVTTPIRP